MSNGQATIEVTNAKEVIKLLGKLSRSQMNKAYKTGLRQAIKPLVKQVRQNLKNTPIKSNVRGGKLKFPLNRDIKSTVKAYRNEGGELVGKVYIKPSGALKWFEMGTAQRFAKQKRTRVLGKKTKTRQYNKTVKSGGLNRGKITPYKFFEHARNEKEKECERILEQKIAESIKKVWEKNK